MHNAGLRDDDDDISASFASIRQNFRRITFAISRELEQQPDRFADAIDRFVLCEREFDAEAGRHRTLRDCAADKHQRESYKREGFYAPQLTWIHPKSGRMNGVQSSTFRLVCQTS